MSNADGHETEQTKHVPAAFVPPAPDNTQKAGSKLKQLETMQVAERRSDRLRVAHELFARDPASSRPRGVQKSRAAHQQNQPRAEWSDNGSAYRQLVRGREPIAKHSSPGGKRSGQSVLSTATNRVGVKTAHRVAVLSTSKPQRIIP